jgi:hypothetical protein
MNTRKPGTSTAEGLNFGDLLVRESGEDSVRDSGARTSTNPREAGATSRICEGLGSGISGEDIREPRKKQSQSCSPKKSGFRV